LGESIKTEIQLLQTVHHPYIVKLHEVMATQQKILLVMEYVNGGDLFDLISKFNLTFRGTKEQYAIRRDVKILFSTDYNGFRILPRIEYYT
jgi:serine/threonine protein kinase